MVLVIYCLRGEVEAFGRMGECVFPVYLLVMLILWILMAINIDQFDLFDRSSDFSCRKFVVNSTQRAAILFLEGLVDMERIDSNVLTPMLRFRGTVLEQTSFSQAFKDNIHSAAVNIGAFLVLIFSLITQHHTLTICIYGSFVEQVVNLTF